MNFNKRFKVFSLITVVIAAVVLNVTVPSAHAITIASFSGTIASGAQTDIYGVALVAGNHYIGDLFCTDGTLDTVLTIYDPNGNVAAFNDDGGTVPCGGFRSSYAEFWAEVSGTYSFHVDGFGASTGPYTLIVSDDPPQGRPIPAGFVQRWMQCSTAVFDSPGGQPVGDNAVYFGQSFYVNPTPVAAANGSLWIEIFLSGTNNAYIPASCI